jgi:NADP-dependent 3-hydroxy acid dehydrogenase YdfG
MSTSRVVWITGASSGIGRALTEQFVSHGDSVVATARSLANLTILQEQLSSSLGSCAIFQCDVTSEEQVRVTAEEILSKFGTIDILLNNAGVTYFKDFVNTSTAEFDEVVGTNLRGLFLTTKAALPGMLERKSGSIINVLSYAAKATYTGSSAYAASKAGAEAMMNVLRAETRDKGIAIVNVYPGAVFTSIWHPKHREKYGHQMIQPADVAQVVYKLSCEPAGVMIEDIVIRPQVGDLRV